MHRKSFAAGLTLVCLAATAAHAALVGYWTFDDPANRLVETSGYQAAGVHDGVAGGTLSFTTAGHNGSGAAATFGPGATILIKNSQTNDPVNSPNYQPTFDQHLADTNAMSVSFWVKGWPTSDWAGFVGATGEGGPAGYNGWSLRALANGEFNISINQGLALNSNTPITDSNWHLIGFSYAKPASTATVTAYIDGVAAGTATSDGSTFYPRPLSPKRMGAYVDGNSSPGVPLDDMAVYDQALTAQDFADLKSGAKSPLSFALPKNPVWSVDTSGSWALASNWGTAVPNAAGATAVLGNKITAPRVVYTESAVTVGTLTFDSADPGSYTLAGARPNGKLTMQQADDTSAKINVYGGSHDIDLPLTFASNTDISVDLGTTLTISNPFTISAGKTVNIVAGESGAGTVVFEVLNPAGGAIHAAGGTLQIGPQAQIASSTLAISGAAQLAGSGQIVNSAVLYTSTAASTFAGTISGTASLSVDAGTGSLRLTGSGAYAGGTNVASGTLIAGGADALPTGKSLTIASGGHVVLASGLGHAISLGGLTITSGAGVGQASPLVQDSGQAGSLTCGSPAAAPTPEPGTIALLAAGAAAALTAWRKRRMNDEG